MHFINIELLLGEQKMHHLSKIDKLKNWLQYFISYPPNLFKSDSAGVNSIVLLPHLDRSVSMGLHQRKVALLVPDDSLLRHTNQNIFRVGRNTRHFSSGISNAI